MNAVGIDVSKGKSMVAIIRPFGEVVTAPYEVNHVYSELKKLAEDIKKLSDETRVVIEATGIYYEPIARYLHNEGIFVSVVNPMLISDFGDNTLRKAKTDKKDSIKIANYALTYWCDLKEYRTETQTRHCLKMLNRQYDLAIKLETTLKNNTITLIDQSFPGINKLFESPARKSDGHEKWVDFILKFPHRDAVAKLSLNVFKEKYQRWCKKNGYNYFEEKAVEIHSFSRECFAVLPNDDNTRSMLIQTIKFLISALEHSQSLRNQMNEIASQLPEYETVMKIYGVGETVGPQLIAEIGDTRRFHNRKAITAYFGYDTEPDDSGKHISKSRPMTKKGSSSLRRTLFVIMTILIKNKPVDDPVYQFIDKKRSEGKCFLVYMNAAANKFLRIYYAKVNEILNNQNSS